MAEFDMSNQEFIDTIQKMVNDNNAQAVKNANDANLFTANQQQIAMQYNSAEAEKNRAFQYEMSNSAHQREVQDLVLAGLNPKLSVNNGASTTSGNAGSISGASGQQASLDMQATSLMANFIINKMNNAQQEHNLNKQLDNAIRLKEMENENARQINQDNINASLQAKSMDIENQQNLQKSGFSFQDYLAGKQYQYDSDLANQGYINSKNLQDDQQKFNRQENYRGYKYNKWLTKRNNSNAYKIAQLQAAASRYGSSVMAAAQRYGSQLGYNAQIYGIDKNYTNNIQQRAHETYENYMDRELKKYMHENGLNQDMTKALLGLIDFF